MMAVSVGCRGRLTVEMTVRGTVVLVVEDNPPDDHRLAGLRQRHQPVYVEAVPHTEGDGLDVVQGTEEGGYLASSGATAAASLSATGAEETDAVVLALGFVRPAMAAAIMMGGVNSDDGAREWRAGALAQEGTD